MLMKFYRDQVNYLLESVVTYKVQNEDSFNQHAYCLAVLFYLGYYPDDEVDSNYECSDGTYEMIFDPWASNMMSQIQYNQDMNNKSKSSYHEFFNSKEHLIELSYWINRALLKLQMYRGNCIRTLKITN